MMTKVQVAANGVVTAPALHDANLIGLFIVSEGHAIVAFRDVLGVQVFLTLTGIERLRADQFLQGNIVLDVTVESGTDVRSERIADMLEIGGNATSAQFLARIMDRIGRRETLLFQVNPTYGCEISCLCRDVNVISSEEAMEALGSIVSARAATGSA